MELNKNTPSKRDQMQRQASIRTATSSVVTSGSSTYNLEETAGSRAVWGGRIVFIIGLVSVAVILGYFSHSLLTDSEHRLTEAQFESIADRATCNAMENMQRKRLGTVSMASVIAGSFPDAVSWPYVAMNNFENIANNVIKTSKGCQIAFAPLVLPEELPVFEEYIYYYYESARQPEAWPNGTAVKPFGKGVWQMDPEGKPVRDTGGLPAWGGTTDILAPIAQHSTGNSTKLLMNFHSDPLIGPIIEDIIACAKIKAESSASLDECVTITKTRPDRMSSRVEAGPGAMIVQPVYPSNEPNKLTGILATQVVWGEIFLATYADSVSGVDVVLVGDDQAFTYHVVGGEAKFVGDGDLHDPTFDSFAVELEVTPEGNFGPTSKNYTLVLYPTQDLYDVYSTPNPMISAVGAVCIIAFTSILFLIYDLFVRREFNSKRELLEAKRKFVRFISHEVRTPLNSVCIGMTLVKGEMAKMQADAASNSKDDTTASTTKDGEEPHYTKGLELVEEITNSAHSAVDVLNDFLNYDKVQSGQLLLEKSIVPVIDIVKAIATEFKMPASKKAIKLSFVILSDVDAEKGDGSLDKNSSTDKYVVGDRIRLSQVFRNLVSNAIKFTPNGGSVRIETGWIPPTKKEQKIGPESFTLQNKESFSAVRTGSIVVSVSDSGAGMTSDQVKTVFRQGTQFNVNQLQRGNGSGLGTYIAKGIVKQHGGMISAKSGGLEQGSTFIVTLPTHDIPPHLVAPKVELTTHQEEDCIEPLNFLVVDDAKVNLKLLMRLLSKHGHKVTGAEDGDEALEEVEKMMAQGRMFDVILMDYQMPRMNGPSASREIRKLGCDSFIVGLTGNIMPEDIRCFKEAGANAVLAKPIKLSELDALLMEYDIQPNEQDDSSLSF